jgi:V/A-type H+-transporting ATPase subunit C
MKLKLEMESEKKIKLGFYPYTYVRSTAMKALLVKKEDYHKLMKMSLSEITKFLQDSEYKKEINELAAQHSGIDLLELALNRNMAASFDKLRKISPDEMDLLIDQYVKRKDIEDIKTILRGKFTNSSIEKIKGSLISAGTLSLDFLYKLAEMDFKEALSNLKIVDFGYLEKAYQEYSETKSLAPIESALDHFYYSSVLDFTRRLPSEGRLFREFLESEIEILNIINLIRLKREKLEKKEIEKYLFFSKEPGKNRKIKRLLGIEDLNELMKALEKEEYGEIIKEGMEDLEKNNSLIKMEIGLYKYLLKKSVLLMHQHPLSVDIILGYMFAKEIEVRNLRLIIKGKQLGLSEDFIEKQLVF